MKKPVESCVVLALDEMSMERALKIAEEASGMVWGFKVHDLLFHYGAEIVYELKRFGNVIADARLYGNFHEVSNAIRIFRTSGADIITVVSPISDKEKIKDLACIGSPHAHGIKVNFGWRRAVEFDGGTATSFISMDGNTLRVANRFLIKSENLTEELEKLNDKSLGTD